MGGRITFCTGAIDKRVVASAPSVLAGFWNSGPILPEADAPLIEKILGSRASIPYVNHAVLFQSPSNDTVMPIERLQMACEKLPTKTYAFTHASRISHRSIPEFYITPVLWFDHHLKGTFAFPNTPSVSIDISDANTSVSVLPDVSREVGTVNLSFRFHVVASTDRKRRWTRLEGAVNPERDNDVWKFKLPPQRPGMEMWVFANVFYPLEKEVNFANWAGRPIKTDKFGVSSALKIIEANASVYETE
jgi:hypothetical protein